MIAGCFDKEGTFHSIPCMPDEEQLAKLFMHKVLARVPLELRQTVEENGGCNESCEAAGVLRITAGAPAPVVVFKGRIKLPQLAVEEVAFEREEQ